MTTAANLTSLSAFIIRNEKVLAALGVFVALSAFFISLPLKSLSSFLAFLSLLATLPLIYELAKDLWRSNLSWSLTVFSNVFSLLIGYFIWYLLIAFREEWWGQMHKVVFWGIFLGLLALYRTFLRKYYQQGFAWIGFRVESALTVAYSHVAAMQLRIWKELQFLQQVHIFGRSRLSAQRQRVFHQRRFSAIVHELQEEGRARSKNRWRSPEPSNELKVVASAMLFVPIFIGVGQLEKPIAEGINIGLDIQAEEYQREKRPSRTIDKGSVPPVPVPTEPPPPLE